MTAAPSIMRVMKPLLLVLATTCVAVAVTACGGGDPTGSGPEPGSGQLTDPAAVPSSTPIAGGLTFLIRDNGVQAPGGASTTVAGGSTPVTTNRGTYTIKDGDICSTIADELGVTVDELLAANRGADCSALIPGTELRIPNTAAATPVPTTTRASGQATPTPGGAGGGTQYEIQPGDLCVDIAASYGVTVEALVAANDLDCDNLRLGQVITIP